jgi:hypothetical protein
MGYPNQLSALEQAEAYVLYPERVWDGLSDDAVEGLAIIVRQDKIAAMIPVADVSSDLVSAQLPGCTVIPGLIDAHVHYSSAMGAGFLAAGVTTVRDVGNDLDWILAERQALAKDPMRGPGLLCCGQLLDGEPAHWHHMGRGHDTPEGLVSSIQEHVDRGVDALKLYAGLGPDMVAAGVAEAHRLNQFVLAHLGGTTAEEAIVAGLDELEHLEGCGTAWGPEQDGGDDTLIDLMLEHDFIITPTLVVFDRLGRILDMSFRYDGRRKWVHACHRRAWDQYLMRFQEPGGRLRLQGAMPHLKRFLRRAMERGVTVALGTDTPFPHLIPGFSVHDELAMYVDAGILPIDALRSATSVNARVLGIESDRGVLKPEFIADMAIVRGNPLNRIEDIGEMVATIHRGRVLFSDALHTDAEAQWPDQLDDPVTRDFFHYIAGRPHLE